MSILSLQRAAERLRIDAAEAAQIRSDCYGLGMHPSYLEGIARAAGIGTTGDLKQDAAETLLFQRALLVTLRAIHTTIYTPTKARKFVPLNREVPAGADSFSWNIFDEKGTAKLIDSGSDDLPQVTLIAAELIQAIKSFGNGFSWSLQQVRSAALAGIPLDARLAKAARDMVERAIELVFSVGISGVLPGMLKNASVPVIAGGVALTGSWLTVGTTAQQMLDDLNIIGNYVAAHSEDALQANTLLLPTLQFQKVSSTIWANAAGISDKTVLQMFLQNQTYIKDVDSWAPLATADAANTGPRAVAYDRSPQTLEGFIPQEFETLPPQAENLKMKVPCHARVGGVAVYQPMGMVYADGI